jgi:hypothetical protein
VLGEKQGQEFLWSETASSEFRNGVGLRGRAVESTLWQSRADSECTNVESIE